MRSFNTNNFTSDCPTVAALGCFDGVHIGHKTVISEAVRIAKERSISSAVWTFNEPPRNYFSPGASPIITDYDEKRRLMRTLGVDIFVSIPFDEKTANMSPQEFFSEIIQSKLKAVHVVCGYNYSFGKCGKGDINLLKKLCADNGIGFTAVEKITLDDTDISSSTIRSAVASGDMESVKKYLGRPYSINTIVIDGQKLARRLGFPTLNQVFARGILVPKRGVYITRVHVSSKKYYGITNVGIRPTVGGKLLCAETHIFSFSGDLYGKKVRVEFLNFMRDETAFTSVEALAEQVKEDINKAKKMLNID